MIKKFLTLIILLTPFVSRSQDTIKTQELNSIQVVGIRVDNQASTKTSFNCDSFSFVNQQKDPFFVLDKLTPSIYAQSDNGQGNGYSYMRLRGFDQTRINFNLNGIPLNEMEDQGIYFSNMPGFYNYLSNISVERGVGSSKYGNTSIGGSVNMETQDMTQKSLTFGTNQNLNGVSNFGGSGLNFMKNSGVNKNGLAHQVGGTWLLNNGFKEHSGNNGGSLFYGLGLFKKHNIIKIWGFTGYSQNQLSFLGSPKNSIGLPDNLTTIEKNYQMNANSEFDRDTFRQSLVVANWINHKSDYWSFNTSAYYSKVKGQYNIGYDTSIKMGSLFGVNSNQIGFMTNLVYKKNSNTVNIGLNSNIYSREHFGYDDNGYYNSPSQSQLYKNTGYKRDLILYYKYTKTQKYITFNYDLQVRSVWFNIRNVSLQNGIEILPNDSFSMYQKTFLNPKIGVESKITTNSKIYFTMSFTQREPTRSDFAQYLILRDTLNRFFNPDNAKIFYLNKNSQSPLLPEKVYDIEWGYKKQTEKAQFNANIFIMSVNNEYLPTGYMDSYSGFMQKQKNDNTLRVGLESDAKIDFKYFKLFYTLTLQHSSLSTTESSRAIPFTPNMITNIGLSKTFGNSTFSVINQYVSQMYMDIDNKYRTSPYNLTNIYVTQKVSNTFTIGINLNNILNQKYYIPAGIGYTDTNYNFYNIPTFYQGQRFNWQLNVRYRING